MLLDRLETPIGQALLVTDGEGRLCALDWSDYEARMLRLLHRQVGPVAIEAGKAPKAIRLALERYFAGDLGLIDTIPCHLGGTPFQREVWSALRAIPAGETSTYGTLATRLGRPRAMRAVGHANGANPISVVVPCHRLIGADGSLTGYGGGIARKRWLLIHEGAALSA
jgi:methylated-DNA-[protein]-cysteine S-methyltransferase